MSMLATPLSMSIDDGVSASTPEIRAPLHPSVRQNRRVFGSRIYSAASAGVSLTFIAHGTSCPSAVKRTSRSARKR
jgi:hypothetical protein